MEIFRKIFTCLVLLILPFSAITFGQITAYKSTNIYDTVTDYSDKVHIFVFNQSSSPKGGPLFCSSADKVNATFVWSQFDTLTYLYDISKGTLSNSNSSVKYCEQGGYRVIVNEGNVIDTFYAWVFLDSFSITYMNKDKNGDVDTFSKSCYSLYLKDSISKLKNFIYYNPSDTSHSKITLENKYKSSSWTFNPKLRVTPAIDTGLNLIIGKIQITTGKTPVFNGKSPAEPTTITVTASDKFNCKIKDSMIYTYPIKSTYSYFRMYKDTLKFDTISRMPWDSLSASIRIFFRDSSQNAITHFWNFNDAPEDTSYEKNPQHIYLLPRQDTVTLLVKSSEGCTDISNEIIEIMRPYIGIDSFLRSYTPNIKMTNAFVPGSTNAPNFYLILRSVDNFQIYIYTKWGTEVNRYDGPATEWKGWDGNNEIGLKCASGIYYYVIHATNWDPYIDPYFNSDGIYKGFLYLFRQD